MALTETAPRLPDIEAARARLEGVARVTPVYRSDTLSRLVGREVHLKAENLQRTGSFKIRGAYNRISTLEADEVVAASAGNHGQAVAWAAREIGARARIFMPQDAPMAKVDATRAAPRSCWWARARSLARGCEGLEEQGATFTSSTIRS